MKAYLFVSALIFTIATLSCIINSKDAGDSVVAVLLAALSAWGFYLWFNL